MNDLRRDIRSCLGLRSRPESLSLTLLDEVAEEGYRRKRISYAGSNGEVIEAFLFEPEETRSGAAVVALHQHNSEWRVGKSEVAGLAGDSLQAFAPPLARSGMTVLAPDAVGFESRCGVPGSGRDVLPPVEEPRDRLENWLQYYNHAMHRIARGKLLIADVLYDLEIAVTLLQQTTNPTSIGLVGHSYGGTVALFAAALDERIGFACSSGAACSYRHKFTHGTPLDMALVIPGFAERYDLDDLMRLTAPRELFVVSSDQDKYAADAEDLVRRARSSFLESGAEESLTHLHVAGEHRLDEERYRAIVSWLTR